MAHPRIAIHPCIGLVDDSPSRASQLDPGKVEGGDRSAVSVGAWPTSCLCVGERSGALFCKVYANLRYLNIKPQFLPPINGVGLLEVVR